MNRFFKRIKRGLSLVVFISVVGPMAVAEAPSIIPAPVTAEWKGTTIDLTRGLKLTDRRVNKTDDLFLFKKFLESQQITLDGDVPLIINAYDEKQPAEGYKLKVCPSGIEVTAADAPGVFYALQTVQQMIESEKAPRLAQGDVVDYPRFAYRGMHLDVGRHWFPLEDIYQFIDYLAMHKLNRFHWHLTEDQGWRLEIKKYPKLTEVGAVRKSTPKRGNRNQLDGVPYGPYFYTQAEAKAVVAYAAQRHITVIPEIELPGHSVAALAAYPNLGCTGGLYEVRCFWGVEEDVYCAGNEEVFEFLEDVLTEVLAIFPSKYIHIGGDECPKTRWAKCPKCLKRIADEKLHDTHHLQSYFINRIGRFLEAQGREFIGWDEILEGGLPKGAIVMSWRGLAGGVAAVKNGNEAILTPNHPYYFDHYQADPKAEPEAIGGLATLQQVYEFEPMPGGLTLDQQKLIKGVQANCWTEYMPTFQQVEYMVLPRMAALAESAWSPAVQKSWPSFESRLPLQLSRYAAMGANFRVPAPFASQDLLVMEDEWTVNFSPSGLETTIVYTLDGTEPTEGSPQFAADQSSVVLKAGTTLKARTILKNGGASQVAVITTRKPKWHQPAAVEPTRGGVKYQLFKGHFRSVEHFNKALTQEAKVTSGFDIPKDAPADYFALTFEGWVEVKEKGVYTFYTQSDDGSCLWVGDQLVVNNDGPHGPQVRNGQVALEPGWHAIRVTYAELDGGATLRVYMGTNPDEVDFIKPDQLGY